MDVMLIKTKNANRIQLPLEYVVLKKHEYLFNFHGFVDQLDQNQG